MRTDRVMVDTAADFISGDPPLTTECGSSRIAFNARRVLFPAAELTSSPLSNSVRVTAPSASSTSDAHSNEQSAMSYPSWNMSRVARARNSSTAAAISAEVQSVMLVS